MKKNLRDPGKSSGELEQQNIQDGGHEEKFKTQENPWETHRQVNPGNHHSGDRIEIIVNTIHGHMK